MSYNTSSGKRMVSDLGCGLWVSLSLTLSLTISLTLSLTLSLILSLTLSLTGHQSHPTAKTQPHSLSYNLSLALCVEVW